MFDRVKWQYIYMTKNQKSKIKKFSFIAVALLAFFSVLLIWYLQNVSINLDSRSKATSTQCTSGQKQCYGSGKKTCIGGQWVVGSLCGSSQECFVNSSGSLACRNKQTCISYGQCLPATGTCCAGTSPQQTSPYCPGSWACK